MPKKIKEINNISDDFRILAENLGAMLLGCVEGADEVAILLHFRIGLTQILVQKTDGVQMFFRKQHGGLAIGHSPCLFCKITQPFRAFGTARCFGNGNQFAKLLRGLVKLNTRCMLRFLHGKVFHHLVVIVASNHVAKERPQTHVNQRITS